MTAAERTRWEPRTILVLALALACFVSAGFSHQLDWAWLSERLGSAAIFIALLALVSWLLPERR